MNGKKWPDKKLSPVLQMMKIFIIFLQWMGYQTVACCMMATHKFKLKLMFKCHQPKWGSQLLYEIQV